jgi:hypothetical protein
MKLILGLSILFSFSAFANDGFDCRSGHSPHGGKFCHYSVSQCEQVDCVKAAECAIDQYSRQVTWSDIKSVKLTGVNFKDSTISFSVKNKNGVEEQTVTVEQKEESCLPVALKVN